MRINRQATDKPHARLRPGDVLTLPLKGQVRVLEVVALATRRGPAPEAQGLYRELVEREAVSGEASYEGGPCEMGGLQDG